MERFELMYEDLEIDGLVNISIVTSPAIEENFKAFSKHNTFSLSKIDEEKRIITGPAMIANKDLIRYDFFGEPYVEFFSAETIRKISEKFMMEGKLKNVNIEHNFTGNDITIVENWIVENSIQDKSAYLGYNLTPGSLMISMKVNNDSVWNMIKNNYLTGFSIEGFFTSKLVNHSKKLSEEENAQKKLDMIKKYFEL
jgi:hypothetical protein